jgi:membrane associated rhomboid family serine protease
VERDALSILNLSSGTQTPQSAPPDQRPVSESPKNVLPQFFPGLTITLLIVNIAIFMIMWWSGGASNSLNLIMFGALIGPTFRAGDYFTLLTSAFLHLNFLHLALNMYALWTMGPLLENLLGTFRFALVYFVSAITGSLLSLCFVKAASAGASGAIFGVAGAMLVLGYRYQRFLRPQLMSVLGPGLVPFFLYNLVFGLVSSEINLAAHIGGAIGGAAYAFIFRPHQDGKLLKRLTVAGALLAIFIAFSFHLAFLFFTGISQTPYLGKIMKFTPAAESWRILFTSMKIPDSYGGTLFGSWFPRDIEANMRGIGFMPQVPGRVYKYEIAVSRGRGGSGLNAWLCNSESNHPGAVIEKFSFKIPAKGNDLILSADSPTHPTLAVRQRYWLVIAPQDIGRDDYGWYLNESVSGVLVGYTNKIDGPWIKYESPYVPPLRILGLP